MPIKTKIETTYTCDKCKEEGEEYAFEIFCEDCLHKLIFECISDLIKKAFKFDYHWNDRDHYIGWETEKEKDIFLRGIKKGYKDALFQIATEFDEDLIELWEDESERIDKEFHLYKKEESK